MVGIIVPISVQVPGTVQYYQRQVLWDAQKFMLEIICERLLLITEMYTILIQVSTIHTGTCKSKSKKDIPCRVGTCINITVIVLHTYDVIY